MCLRGCPDFYYHLDVIRKNNLPYWRWQENDRHLEFYIFSTFGVSMFFPLILHVHVRTSLFSYSLLRVVKLMALAHFFGWGGTESHAV